MDHDWRIEIVAAVMVNPHREHLLTFGSCLAITEAFAGSDVAGIRTTAKVSDDGQHYIIAGTKKWITYVQKMR